MSNPHLYDPLWLTGCRPDDRKWHRGKKYKPQHRKQKMLRLRRALRKMSYANVHYLLTDDILADDSFVGLIKIDGHGYWMSDVRRVLLSTNRIAQRLLNLRYYW